MSLRVWLPLTKDLRNQGLDDVTVTNIGATFNANGKLGGCYEFASGKRIQTTLPASTSLNTKAISFACWIYVTSWNSSYDCFMSIADNTYWNTSRATLCRNNTASTLVWNIADGTNRAYVTTTTALSLNTWTHVVGTYDGTNLKIYINGVLNNTSATTLSIGYAGTFNIGGWSGNNYPFNGYLNDVRIYNHCLSPLEVKQISQGLILHYPLNRNGWGQENLITGYDTSFLSYSDGTVTLFNNQMNGGTQEIVSNIEGATKCLHLHSNGGSNRQYGTLSATSGKSYTISCDYYSTSSQSIPFRGELNGGNYNWVGSNAVAYTTPNKWVRLSFSYLNLTSDATIFYFMQCSQNTDCYIKNLKIEEGSVATPWCPNSSDTLATTLGLNDNVEYDTSGYGNNGEYYSYNSLGSIEYNSNTPKYNVCTFINSDNNTTNTASGTRYLYGHCGLTNPNQMTIAFWCNPIAGYSGGTFQGQFCTTNYAYRNTEAGSDYRNSAMNHRDGTVDINDSASSTQCRPTINFIANEWHHYVVTYDGQNGKTYQDGVLQDTKSFNAPKILDSFIGVIIGFSKAGGVWRSNKSYYSDFRIYATALSADDVKSLYNNSAYIDNQGNIYGAVYEEV